MPTGVYKRTKRILAIHRACCQTEKFRKRAKETALRSWRNPEFKKKFISAAKKRAAKAGLSIKKAWRKKSVKLNHIEGVEFVRLLWDSLKSLGYQREFHIPIKKRKQPKLRGNWHYLIDFALPEAKIAIECDGPHHRFYSKRTGVIHDKTRDKKLHALGWKVIRVPHD